MLSRSVGHTGCQSDIDRDFKQTRTATPGDAGVINISAKIETCRITKVKICLVQYKDYKEIFFLPLDVPEQNDGH